MIFVPLPFVVSLLLLLLLIRMLREAENPRAMLPFLLLIGGYATLTAVIGLRWGYNRTELLPVMLTLAALLPPLAWHAYSTLSGVPSRLHSAAVVLAPPVLAALLMAWRREFVDWFLAANTIAFGVALLLLAWKGQDRLTRVSFDKSQLVHRSLLLFALLLISSGLVDILIAVDFAVAGGAYAASYVSAANVVGILVLGFAASVAGDGRPDAEADDQETDPPSNEHHEMAQRIDDLVQQGKFYLDPDLTLNRLARRTLIPARRISEAVNRSKRESVSTYINRFRINEACRLLAETGGAVTSIMFESGFQTKSNFNREFLRQTGLSPAAWRQAHKATES